MPNASPGDVWLVDLGMVAKTRPCLVLSEWPRDDELALVVLVPHTTAVRGNRWELVVPKPFLKPGAFHLQQIQAVPIVRLQKPLGRLDTQELQTVRRTLVRLLNLDDGTLPHATSLTSP